MHQSAASSSSKPSWHTIFSTMTCSVVGMVLVAIGTLPLMFLLMLLATTSAARTDSLVWAGTVLLGCLVTGGWLLTAYGWSHSRLALILVIALAVLWAGFMLSIGSNVVANTTQGIRLDSSGQGSLAVLRHPACMIRYNQRV